MDGILERPERGSMHAGDENVMRWQNQSQRHIKQLSLLEQMILKKQEREAGEMRSMSAPDSDDEVDERDLMLAQSRPKGFMGEYLKH